MGGTPLRQRLCIYLRIVDSAPIVDLCIDAQNLALCQVLEQPAGVFEKMTFLEKIDMYFVVFVIFSLYLFIFSQYLT